MGHWSAIIDQVEAGYSTSALHEWLWQLWAAAPATLLVFAASAPLQMGAYQLLAANGCQLYVGSATSPRGLRKRLCEHLAHVQAGEYGALCAQGPGATGRRFA